MFLRRLKKMATVLYRSKIAQTLISEKSESLMVQKSNSVHSILVSIARKITTATHYRKYIKSAFVSIIPNIFCLTYILDCMYCIGRDKNFISNLRLLRLTFNFNLNLAYS